MIRFLAAGLALATLAAAQPVKKVLFFTKSSLFEHSVIVEPGRPFQARPGSEIPGLAFKVLRDLGAKHAIAFTFSKDGRLFTPGGLAPFDAFCFYTTGTLTEAGTDGNPAMPPQGKEVLLDAIRSGKGFVGIHSGSDTFHSPGGEDAKAPARFRGDDGRTDPYIKMLGGEFIIHGQQQESHLKVVDRAFPGIGGFGSGVTIKEEWYSLKNFAPDLHVLLVQETKGMTGAPYARPNYPSTWIRRHGQGRIFYTSLGHRDDVWESARYQELLAGAFDWTTGRVEADTTPNLTKVAPEAGVLPKDLP